MMDRRVVLKWGVLAPLAAGVPQGVLAAMPQSPDGFVIDRRFATAEPAAPRNAKLFHVDGDVTALWYETLDPIWRKPGFVLGGVTGKDVLFVLETLAPDRGRRVISRRPLPPAEGDREGPIAWVIAPVHPSVKA